MSVFKLFKPAPIIPQKEDPQVIKKEYSYWRFRIFYGMFIGYIFYYFTRKSFIFAMPALMKDLNLQISDLGIISSILSISYGLSKFISGIFADRSNPRFVMAVGLILTGIFNIFFGMSSSILLFALFWGLNGWFQGWGWPACGRLLTHWYSQNERGRWWGVWNTSHSIGGALIPFIVAFCIHYGGWRYALYLPGLLCILLGFFLINRLRDTPQSLGLPPIEEFRSDYPENHSKQERELSLKEILFTYVLTNKLIWILAIAYFFVYVIRQAVNDFGAFFLINQKNYSMLAANVSIFWFEAGGMCGSLAAGWASDLIFKGRRGPINALFSFLAAAATLGLYFTPGGMIFLDYLLMFFIGFFIFGPQMLIGIAAAELSHKKAVGTATGFTGWWAYIGAAFAGYPITKIIELFGWWGFFVTLAACGCISTLLLFPLWNIRSNPKYTLAKDNSSMISSTKELKA